MQWSWQNPWDSSFQDQGIWVSPAGDNFANAKENSLISFPATLVFRLNFQRAVSEDLPFAFLCCLRVPRQWSWKMMLTPKRIV